VRQLRALVPHLLKVKKPRDGSFVLFLADEKGASSHVHLLYSDTETLSWYSDIQSPLIILKLLNKGADEAMTNNEITALRRKFDPSCLKCRVNRSEFRHVNSYVHANFDSFSALDASIRL